MIKRVSLWLTLMVCLLSVVACGQATTTSASAITCRPLPNGKGPFTYVALGASDAVGIGATCADTDSYVALLGQRMPKNTHVINLGIAGIKVADALTDEVPAAVAAHPNIITVWLAANDFRAMESGTLTFATYMAQLDQLLTVLTTQTQAHVYVGDLPDLTKLPAFKEGKVALNIVAQQTQAWNAAIAALVATHHAVLVDLFSTDLADHPEYIFSDGFHPTTLGYRRLADAFWAVIQAHGGPGA